MAEFDVDAQVRAFAAHFRKAGSPERAAGEQKYLKTTHRFHGVTVPFIRSTAKQFLREQPALPHADVVRLAVALGASEFHDLRSLGIALLELDAKRLELKDAKPVEALLRGASTWDHIDWLSTKVLGPLVAGNASLVKTLHRFADDESFWMRRASMLALLDELRAGGGDFALFEELAVPMLEEKEFFIRKAIGWILRDVSRKRPKLTEAFLRAHLQEVSGLTFREASRHLPRAVQDDLQSNRERPKKAKRSA